MRNFLVNSELPFFFSSLSGSATGDWGKAVGVWSPWLAVSAVDVLCILKLK